MLKYRDANDPVSFWFWKGVPHMNEKHMQYVLTVLKEAQLYECGKEALCLPALFEPDHKDGRKQSRRSDL